jgi:transcription elongation factor GreA-like protein
METKFKLYKDGSIWINPCIFISDDDIDFDHSYTRQLENSKDTETITHYYTDDQKNQIINHIISEVFNFFSANKDDLLKEGKIKAGSGNRIESFEN